MKYFIAFCSLFSMLAAEIIEFSNFKNLSSHITKDTLLILDIDDTLLVPVQMLGCDEWFNHRFHEHRKTENNTRKALDKTISEWEAIRHITDMEIVEPKTDELIISAQKDGYRVMGLTTQGMTLALRTVEQLAKQNIDLTLTAPSLNPHYISQMEQGVLYNNGILFTSGTHKGKSLFHFLDLINYHPKQIVFVNDKANHLSEVEKTSQERGIEFLGLRYSYSDERKKAFRQDVADYQFRNSSFYRIISDEEALRFLEKISDES